jgi:hypothetical protein
MEGLAVRRTFRLAVFTAGFLLSASTAFAESRLALVIGQSTYRAVPALPNPVNDAKAMSDLLTDAGFDVVTASDLSQNEMREAVSSFAGRIAAKGPDTVALVFYAGHGLQVDGENYLVPIDVDPKREADVPLQSVRLNDLLNTLTSVPSKMRIVMLDACRNNPFPQLNKTVGKGLAIVDAKFGASGTFISFSTAPGAEAEDGAGANSPYTAALLTTAREPGLPIESAFKRVRVSVNKVTSGRQTPWESSSLTDQFAFFAGQGKTDTKTDAKADAKAEAKPAAEQRSREEWRKFLKGKPVEAANELVVADGTLDAYQAFVELYTEPPFAPQAREWVERQLRMRAWEKAVLENTAAGYRAFLAAYPDSDLTPTARKLEERLRNRPEIPNVVAAATGGGSGALAALPVATPATAPTCACSTPPEPKKAEPKKTHSRKRAKTEPQKPSSRQPSPPARRPPPEVVYDDDPAPLPPPPVLGGGIIRIVPGIGGPIGGSMGGGGRYDTGRGGTGYGGNDGISRGGYGGFR